jgi:TPR repeat protein
MKVLGALLVAAEITLFSLSLAAQESLPDSYLQKLATIDRLKKLTLTDLADVTSRAQLDAPEAQYQLALAYGAGLIVPRDEATARRWMRKSAEQGYVPAESGMGEMYLYNQLTDPVPNYADADRWLRLAAMQGDAEAQLWLGIGYDRGYFGGIDCQESLKWLRKSADQGLPDAQVALAQMYQDGHGVAQSSEDADSWFRRAADHYSDISGVFQAEVELAYRSRDGRLRGNDVEAYMWIAVVDSLVDPPIDPATDDDLKKTAKRMTPTKIAEAQQTARDWIDRHPRLYKLAAGLNP